MVLEVIGDGKAVENSDEAVVAGFPGVNAQQTTMSALSVGDIDGELVTQLLKLVADMLTVGGSSLDTPAGMQDGGVIAPAELGSKRLQRDVRQFPAQVDSDLAGPGDLRRSRG